MQPERPQQQQPQGTIQAAEQVAQGVVSGLQNQPILLAIVVLNIVAIGAALWFLNEIVEISHHRIDNILKACLPNYGGKD